MEFIDLIQKRYSVRAYRSDPVEEDKLQMVLEAARLAPTAANRQPFQLILIHTAGREEELGQVYEKEWFTQAPLVICACGLPGEAWVSEERVNYAYVDVAIVMDHLILAAAHLGLGTCWVAAFDRAKVRQLLGLPDEVEPVVMTPLGYPADQPKAKERKGLSELVRYEHW